MKEKFKDWNRTLVFVCIYLVIGILGYKLGWIHKHPILPTTVGSTIGYLIVKGIKNEKLDE